MFGAIFIKSELEEKASVGFFHRLYSIVDSKYCGETTIPALACKIAALKLRFNSAITLHSLQTFSINTAKKANSDKTNLQFLQRYLLPIYQPLLSGTGKSVSPQKEINVATFTRAINNYANCKIETY